MQKLLTWSILSNYFAYGLSFYAIDDPVADTRNKMAIGIDVDIALYNILSYLLSRHVRQRAEIP